MNQNKRFADLIAMRVKPAIAIRACRNFVIPAEVKRLSRELACDPNIVTVALCEDFENFAGRFN